MIEHVKVNLDNGKIVVLRSEELKFEIRPRIFLEEFFVVNLFRP